MEFHFRIVSVAIQLIFYIAQLKKFCVDSIEFSVYKIMSPVNVVQLLKSCLDTAIPWTVARQASLSFTVSQSLLKFMSIKLVMPSNHLIVSPFSFCPQSFPAIGTFPMSQLFAPGGQSIGVSGLASVLPMNIQD